MGLIFELLLLAAAFYIGMLVERYGSVGKAARQVSDKVTGTAQKVADDFNKKDEGR